MTRAALAETWVCSHGSPERENLTFMPQADGTVAWQHQKLGSLDPLALIVNSDGLLTMSSGQKMGKSLGNYIGISEEPYEMMKKFMQMIN